MFRDFLYRIVEVTGVSNEAASQALNVILAAGDIFTIIAGVASILTLGWAAIGAVGWGVFVATVKSIFKKYGARAAVAY